MKYISWLDGTSVAVGGLEEVCYKAEPNQRHLLQPVTKGDKNMNNRDSSLSVLVYLGVFVGISAVTVVLGVLVLIFGG